MKLMSTKMGVRGGVRWSGYHSWLPKVIVGVGKLELVVGGGVIRNIRGRES